MQKEITGKTYIPFCILKRFHLDALLQIYIADTEENFLDVETFSNLCRIICEKSAFHYEVN